MSDQSKSYRSLKEWQDAWLEQAEQITKLRAEVERLRKALSILRSLISTLAFKVPRRPKAITWEDGVDILNYVQDEFLDKCEQALAQKEAE